MSLLFSCSLFFTSFWPLWLSVLFIDIKSLIEKTEYPYTEYIGSVCILFFMLVSLIIIFLNMRVSSKEGVFFHRIEGVSEEKTLTAEYLLSYILPLFAFDFTVWSEVVLFLLFFFTLGFLCVRHQYFSVNIVLEIMGYRFYRCEMINEDMVPTVENVISKRKLSGCKGDEVWLRKINNEYRLLVDEN